jgi:hypothetical protein
MSCFVFAILAYSGLPLAVEPQSGSKHTHQEQRGTENAPYFIDGHVTTRKDNAEAQKDAKESKEKSEIEMALVKWTAWLAVVTFLLFLAAVVQIYVFRRQLKQMREDSITARVAANAALAQANANFAAERAYIFVEVEFVIGGFVDEGERGQRITANVKFENHGKSPAIIKLILADLLVNPLSFYPDSISIVNGRRHPDGLIIGAGTHKTIEVVRHITQQQLLNVDGITENLLCFGKIEYRTILGTEEETGFCWQMMVWRGTRSFNISPTTQLNYYTEKGEKRPS